MNYAGSQEIIAENGDHSVLFHTMVSLTPVRNLVAVDRLSVWGLAYVHNQQRNMPWRQRTFQFPPGDCCCFPPKIAPSSLRDVLRDASHFLEVLEHSLVKVASRRDKYYASVSALVTQWPQCWGGRLKPAVLLKRKELLAGDSSAL
jgi:hypothetical protein